jgi:hypothetical protein
MEGMRRIIKSKGRITTHKTIKMAVLYRVRGHGAVIGTEEANVWWMYVT